MSWTLLFLLVLAPAWANDRSIFSVGGRPTVSGGEHPSVRMVDEWVQLDVYPDFYWTTAEFVFENSGPATFVTMGFPERDRVRDQGFQVFRTWVDGAPVSARRVEVETDPNADHWIDHWLKEVHFEAGQRRLVRVEYRARPGTVVTGARYVEYDFTGKNWAGSIHSSELVINMHVPYFENGRDWVKPAEGQGFTRIGSRLSRRWQDWNEDKSVGFYYVPDRSQFLSWGVPSEEYPGLYRNLTEKDLVGQDDWALYLMENEILARSGKPFVDPQLRQYFQAKCWYRADDDYRSPADLEGWNLIRRARLKR